MIRCARRQIPPLAAWLGAGRRTPPLVAHPTALEPVSRPETGRRGGGWTRRPPGRVAPVPTSLVWQLRIEIAAASKAVADGRSTIMLAGLVALVVLSVVRVVPLTA